MLYKQYHSCVIIKIIMYAYNINSPVKWLVSSPLKMISPSPRPEVSKFEASQMLKALSRVAGPYFKLLCFPIFVSLFDFRFCLLIGGL